MIPSSLLKKVAKKLTEDTQQNKLQWQRERIDLESFKLTRGPTVILVRYQPDRVQEDAIQFVVQNAGGEEIGSFIAREDDKDSYDILSDLVFTIQRSENRSNIRVITDELIKLLPGPDRERWGLK